MVRALRTGLIDDAVRATILRNFTAREVELADEVQSDRRPWRWVEGVTLFPEGRCPYCQGTMFSNRIWKLGGRTAGYGVLHGQYRIVPPAEGKAVGRLVQEAPKHPHVSGTNVCMGNSESVSQALFFGINPRGAYWGGTRQVKDWLRQMFGHDCARPDVQIVEVQCPTCPGSVVTGVEHDCRNTPCGCPCNSDCMPAYGTCECSCGSACRCPRSGVDGMPVNNCPHDCCLDCCRNRNCQHRWR